MTQLQKDRTAIQGFINIRANNFNRNTDDKLKSKLIKSMGADRFREACKGDLKLFIESMLTIQNKEAKLVPLKLNTPQLEIYDKIMEDKHLRFLSTPKSRQNGISVIISALSVAKLYTEQDTINGVVGLDSTKTRELFTQRYLWFYKAIPSELKKDGFETEYENKNKLSLINGNSIIAEHQSLQTFRGSSINGICHLTESAHWENGLTTVLSSADASISSNCLVVNETTSNGRGNEYYEFIKDTIAGKFDKRTDLIFLEWHKMEEYSLDLELASKGFKELLSVAYDKADLTKEEKYILDVLPNLQRLYGKDEGFRKANWYYSKYMTLGSMVFGEYPPTVMDSFVVLEGTYFDLQVIQQLGAVAKEPIRTEKVGSFKLETYKHRKQGARNYAFGVDLSNGVGRDYTVITVVERDTLDVVAVAYSNTSNIQENCSMIGQMWVKFQRPVVCIESNSMGVAHLSILSRKMRNSLWRDKTNDGSEKNGVTALGHSTTASSKARLWINTREELESKVPVLSKQVQMDVAEIKVNPDVSSDAQVDNKTHTSDFLMSYMFALLSASDPRGGGSGLGAPILTGGNRKPTQVYEWSGDKLVPSTTPNYGRFR